MPFFGGLKIWNANPQIVDKLREVGALFHAEKFTHSYMHCWRHKTPIIYRATTQWFAGMDDVPGFQRRRSRAGRCARPRCAASRRRSSIPRGARRACYGMIANRPDWTLSRQRQWGVPLPFFVDSETDELHPDTLALLELAAAQGRAGRHRGVVRRRRYEDFGVDAEQYRKLTDTLDVWFDSGLDAPDGDGRPEGRTGIAARIRIRPAFRPTSISKARTSIAAGSIRRCSSSCMLNGVPPYKALLTHGFVGRRRRQARCRSRRATSSRRRRLPTRSAPRSCACGSAPPTTRASLSISDEILKRVVESYRRIRNTLRFLLANTADFDRAQRRGARSTEMFEIDRFALAQAAGDGRTAAAPTTRATNSTSSCSGCRRTAPRISAASISTC